MDDHMYGHTQRLLIEMRGFAGDCALNNSRRVDPVRHGSHTARDAFILPKQAFRNDAFWSRRGICDAAVSAGHWWSQGEEAGVVEGSGELAFRLPWFSANLQWRERPIRSLFTLARRSRTWVPAHARCTKPRWKGKSRRRTGGGEGEWERRHRRLRSNYITIFTPAS